MFFIGIVILMIGAIFVYRTNDCMKLFRMKNLIRLKGIGLIVSIIGVLMILYGEFPKSLEFIRIFFGRIFKDFGIR
ncbi:hypothetical protein [Crassaminicella profunda]|uniref:hypothetical protein n=1 Tax=Crassaminicella profunda TaxID=1286698 RepID=UPI001CA6F820|nr:hypothetical protein [Crassaminicella profunda]QZY56238.1 hypothetical protein K7H06_04420 [Crassaminicella profunda]